MKKCKDCGIRKPVAEFYPTQGECKVCTRKRVRENRIKRKSYYEQYDQKRNRENYRLMCLRKYSMMRGRVLGTQSHPSSAEGKGIMSKSEFLEWCDSSEDSFRTIQKSWKKSGYQRRLAPSIDRIDNSKGYIIGNLQWLPLYLNIKKDIGKCWENRNRNKKGQFV